MSEHPITDPHKPIVESGFDHELRLAKNNHICPWRSNHRCHIPEDVNKELQVHLDRFQRCLLCMLGEILRELEFRRLG